MTSKNKKRRRLPALDSHLRRHGLTRKDVATELGVTPALVSHWITGEVRIPAERAKEVEDWSGGSLTLRDLRPDLFTRKSDSATR